MTAYADALRQTSQTMAFVPTMGFLHQGHLTLMEEGLKKADKLVVSIFVNPAQFGPNEDLDTYPRALERDLKLCEEMGASAVFCPNAGDMYPEGFQTWVELEKLPQHLCGLSRPVFFKGIATVVTKLFNIVKPHVALFGEKDFQQLALIRQMVKDLCFDIEICGVPIVREADGLAMSSRNKYLTEAERPEALRLSQCLTMGQEMVELGTLQASRIRDAAVTYLEACPLITVDYVSLCDPVTLDEVENLDGNTLMAIAVTLGKTRLIDNTILMP
ncbi:MAG: pantoate--beta-alanine ligase [Desulfobacterales bacterium]|nr:pantoate--beta-alanine ligase [Desulfobacterales bacterium]